ncbi:MAG: adenosylcobinamide-phosphate synthase CbiB [Chloroflexota bacterium]
MKQNARKEPSNVVSSRAWSCLVLPLALVLDVTLGDPTNRWHPVAWMGAAIGFLQKQAPKHGRIAQFFYGTLIAIGGGSICGIIGGLLLWFSRRVPKPLTMLLEAYLLKMVFSLGGLLKAGEAVKIPLSQGNLDEARQQLGWHLVSRDTTQLDESQVAAATIESLAENTSDSVIAPLFFYAIGGLPAAYAYRFLNTADAMLGYRDAAREWLGKAPARLDDMANIVPARLTALLMIFSAPTINGSRQNAWAIWRRDAGKTSSPNAGHPMAATAGALEVELDKVDHYSLGEGQRRAHWTDIDRAIWLVRLVVGVAVSIGTIVSLVWQMQHRNRIDSEI